MKKITYESTEVDNETQEVKKTKTITREVNSIEHFYRQYSADIGVLRKCTKKETDLLTCCLENKFIEYNTNELILNIGRRKVLAECSGIKIDSVYNIINRLKSKGILVTDKNGTLFLNPLLYFSGSEIERSKLLELKIIYVIREDSELNKTLRANKIIVPNPEIK